MAWYAVYDTTTGQLRSVAQVVASPLPDGLAVLELAARPNLDSEMWDEATRAFVARPAKVTTDRLQEILNHPDYGDFQTVWNSLNNANRTRLRDGMIRLLGRRRYRNPSESLTVEA